jgi:hypothetical protein
VKKAPDPVLSAGWKLVKDDETGVQIGVPSGWQVGMDSPASLTGLANSLGNASPDQTSPDLSSVPQDSALQQLQTQMAADSAKQEKEALEKLRAKGIILHVIDGSKPTVGEERTKYTVQKLDKGHNVSLEEARDEEVEYFKGWGANPAKLVNLPIGPAYRIDADYKTRGGDEVERVSYVVVDGTNSYFLRFVSTNNPQAVLSVEKDVADSWRIPIR